MRGKKDAIRCNCRRSRSISAAVNWRDRSTDGRTPQFCSTGWITVGGLDPYLFASYFIVSLFLICGPSAFRCSMHLFVNMCSDLIACTCTTYGILYTIALIVAIYLRFLNTVISQIKYDTVNCLIQQLTINSCQQSSCTKSDLLTLIKVYIAYS